jgi:GDP-mannose 6-dehydrogenase
MAQVGKDRAVKVNIFGLGYVGSVSAACLAADGHEVLGIDIDRTKVDSINRGESPVIEPGLPQLMNAAVTANRLRASADVIEDADISIVCVGTPSNDNGSLRLTYLSRATEQIGDFLGRGDRYHVVCIRSTVLPGTVESHVIPILEARSHKTAGRDFGVCMNPEFLREGSSIRDYHAPPFTIIGELDAHSGDMVEQLYSKLSAPVIRTRLAVAEMVKYAGNAFHALKITFANEIGTLAKRLDIDGTEVM